jgi:hypothetical protein
MTNRKRFPLGLAALILIGLLWGVMLIHWPIKGGTFTVLEIHRGSLGIIVKHGSFPVPGNPDITFNSSYWIFVGDITGI